ncbi:MAG: DUF6870 family protein [Anaerocolumna sp.]
MEEKEKLVEQLRTMKEMDIQTVDKESLVDIKDVKINPNLSDEERMLDFIRQIKNPYCYLDNGMVVKVSFEGKSSLEEALNHYIKTIEG